MHTFKVAAILLSVIQLTIAGNCSVSAGIPNAAYYPGFCGWTFATGLAQPRGMEVLPNGDILVLTRGSGSITELWEEADGSTGTVVIYSGSIGLNHAVRYYNGYIYASSDTTVYRWNWTSPRANLGAPTVILTGMPAGGNHNTRTLEFKDAFMFINIGSQNNIDTDSSRSRIVRVSLDGTLPKSYGTDTVVYADGTRNVVGLRVDGQGRLWGVENGIDNIGNGEARSDLGNVAQYNPAEEVNIFTDANLGRFYGYPHCWSEGLIPDGNRAFDQATGQEGTQWSTYNTVYNDTWCRNPANVIPPSFTFQAHHAPLDIIFLHNYTVALITSHGTNRSVLMLPLDASGNPAQGWEQLEYLVHGPFASTWNVDPVAMAYAPCKSYGMCVYFSDDNAGIIYAVAMNSSSSSSSLPASSSAATSSSSSAATSSSELTPASSSESGLASSNTQQISRSGESSSIQGNEDNAAPSASMSIGALLIAFTLAVY